MNHDSKNNKVYIKILVNTTWYSCYIFIAEVVVVVYYSVNLILILSCTTCSRHSSLTYGFAFHKKRPLVTISNYRDSLQIVDVFFEDGMEVEEGQPLFVVKRGEDLKVSIISISYTPLTKLCPRLLSLV